MPRRCGVYLLGLTVVLAIDCDTSPKPTVTPQPEVSQPAGDKENDKSTDKENKSATAAPAGNKTNASKESKGDQVK
jgi:hypothetical protein